MNNFIGGLFGEEFVGLKQLDELDAAIEWQQRIEMAKFKWTNARLGKGNKLFYWHRCIKFQNIKKGNIFVKIFIQLFKNNY